MDDTIGAALWLAACGVGRLRGSGKGGDDGGGGGDDSSLGGKVDGGGDVDDGSGAERRVESEGRLSFNGLGTGELMGGVQGVTPHNVLRRRRARRVALLLMAMLLRVRTAGRFRER